MPLPLQQVTVVNEDERIFESILSAEMADNQNILVSPSEVKKWIDTFIQKRNGPLLDIHKNKPVGKVLDWWEVKVLIDDDVIERAVKANPQNSRVRAILERYKGETIPCIAIRAQIFDHYEYDDEVWNKLKSGEYTGVSFGGDGENAGYDQKHGAIKKLIKGMMEVSVVDKARVAIALLTGINDIAQRDDQDEIYEAAKSCDENICQRCQEDIMKETTEDIQQGRTYIKDSASAPKGAKVQRGKKGGLCYEDSGASNNDEESEKSGGDAQPSKPSNDESSVPEKVDAYEEQGKGSEQIIDEIAEDLGISRDKANALIKRYEASRSVEQSDSLKKADEDKDTMDKSSSPNSTEDSSMTKNLKQADEAVPVAAEEQPETSPLEEIRKMVAELSDRVAAIEAANTPAEEAPVEQADPGAQEGDKEPAQEIEGKTSSPDESKDVAQRDTRKVRSNVRGNNDIAQTDGVSALAIARGNQSASYAQIREAVR